MTDHMGETNKMVFSDNDFVFLEEPVDADTWICLFEQRRAECLFLTRI